ncbi:glycosyltransferase family 4 protein [Candidatus Daviesbacteria bacterium]|nr:glycosyltransferase family 4 protein [Candidatus Daviesbacteria bacterium]
MIIGIDANEANQNQKVGIGQYAYWIIKSLYQLDTKNSYLIYLKNKLLSGMPQARPNWQYRIIGPSWLWTQWRLPWSLIADRPQPDVFLSLTHYAPRFCPVPLLVSVMDLSYLEFGDYFKKSDLYQLKNWTKYSVERANTIIAISQSTKNDITKHYKIEPDKIHVVYPGYDREKFMVAKNDDKLQQIKTKYGIAGPFIISVGTLQPRKNYLKLLEALARVKGEGLRVKGQVGHSLSSSPFSLDALRLVIAGKKGWLYHDIFSKVKELGLERDVVFTDFIADDDLAVLYNCAQAFVLVSLYEGFGIPVVEAMACGCPVVVSNISSLPEVSGDAGILVDPNSADNIAQGIIEALDKREDLSAKALVQAQKFDWQTSARQVLLLLEATSRNKSP